MRVVFASVAYLTAMAGGVKVLIASAHSLATAASPLLHLPPTKPNNAPTLVERRLIAQSAPDPVNPPLRKVLALDAPDMSIAQLAVALDSAETAYTPALPESIVALREPAGALDLAVAAVAVALQPASEPSAAAPAIHDVGAPLLVAAALEITRAEFGKTTVTLAKRKPKPGKGSLASKRKGKALLTARLRGPVRLASLETPGVLMYRGFVKQQS